MKFYVFASFISEGCNGHWGLGERNRSSQTRSNPGLWKLEKELLACRFGSSFIPSGACNACVIPVSTQVPDHVGPQAPDTSGNMGRRSDILV
ncbi:MAG: hypothetical protein ACE5IO_01375 [Thermoplasmata archaeon]